MAKYRFLSDMSKEQKLDFIALLETEKKSKTILNNICGGNIKKIFVVDKNMFGTGLNLWSALAEPCGGDTGRQLVAEPPN